MNQENVYMGQKRRVFLESDFFNIPLLHLALGAKESDSIREKEKKIESKFYKGNW